MPDHRNRPRRRGQVLEQALLAACLAELTETGYAALTMEAVARRAGAGKVSLYKRWPTRAELVMAAIAPLIVVAVEPADTGSLRGDLVALLGDNLRLLHGPAGEAMRGILADALRSDDLPSLARLTRGGTVQGIRVILQRARERGEPVGEPTALQLGAASAILRYLHLAGTPIGPDLIEALVDEIALPLLR